MLSSRYLTIAFTMSSPDIFDISSSPSSILRAPDRIETIVASVSEALRWLLALMITFHASSAVPGVHILGFIHHLAVVACRQLDVVEVFRRPLFDKGAGYIVLVEQVFEHHAAFVGRFAVALLDDFLDQLLIGWGCHGVRPVWRQFRIASLCTRILARNRPRGTTIARGHLGLSVQRVLFRGV